MARSYHADTAGLILRIIPFSERKGFANRKCLYVCPTNQEAAFLNKRGNVDFRFKAEWD